MIIIETFPVGVLQCNCTILGCEETRRGLVVDPGKPCPDPLRSRAARPDLRGDSSHPRPPRSRRGDAGAGGIDRRTGPPGIRKTKFLMTWWSCRRACSASRFQDPSRRPSCRRRRRDGGGADQGRDPPHARAHPRRLCLSVPDSGHGKPEPRLFAGDTLFLGSIGRTDLWGGSMDAILHSIHQRVLGASRRDDRRAGTRAMTTIGHERRDNPFLQ